MKHFLQQFSALAGIYKQGGQAQEGQVKDRFGLAHDFSDIPQNRIMKWDGTALSVFGPLAVLRTYQT